MAGKQVALPEGDWTLVARGYSRAPQMTTDAYGAIETDDPVPAGPSARGRLRRRQPQRGADRGRLGHRQRMPRRGRRAAPDRQLRRRGRAHFLRFRRRGAQRGDAGFAERLEGCRQLRQGAGTRSSAAMVDGGLPPERPAARSWTSATISTRSCAGPSAGQRRSGRPGIGRLAGEHARARAHRLLQRLGRVGADAHALDRGCRRTLARADGEARAACGACVRAVPWTSANTRPRRR